MVAALILAAAVAASASPSPSPSPSAVAPVPIGSVTVVTGSAQSLHRAPQPASVLDARALRAASAPSLDQLLRALPGFDRNRSNAPFTNYGQLRLSFAGAGSDRGALFVDGVPAQDGFGGQVDWNALPVEDVERAELLRGPGSALYGSGAIGGALSLTTVHAARGGALSASAGGIDRGSGTLLEGARLGDADVSVFASTRRLGYAVAPPDQHSPADRAARSTAEVVHVAMRRAGAHDGLQLDASAAGDAQEDGRPNNGFARALRQLALGWTHADRGLFAVTAYARATTVTNLADRNPSLPGELLYTQHVPTSDAGVRARWTLPLGRAAGAANALTVLLDHRMVSGRSDQLAPNGAVQSDVAGTQQLDGFALQTATQGRLGTLVGARYDAVRTRAAGERSAAAVSPRIALRYDVSPALAARAAYGTGLRAPYLNELVRSFRIGTTQFQNNAGLVPERSRSGQLGLDLATSATSRLALDYTGTRVRDAIGFSTIAAGVQQRSNFGRTASDAFTGEYERGTSCSRVRAFGVAQHARVAAGAAAQVGKRLAYVPGSAASLALERTVGRLAGALEVSYSGPTFADDLERQPLGTAVLIGGRLTLQTAGGAALSLAVDNLADKLYLTSIDRLGAPASVTLRLSVPTGARAAATRAAACG